MEGLIVGLVVIGVFVFIASRSESVKSKVHEWTKPKPGGTTKEK